MKLASISVLVITYNQQEVIGRALESILCQMNWGLKEIIICDDCSTDNSWNIILEYAVDHTSIIQAYRNSRNTGIYQNLQKLFSYRGDADLYYALSGDDALCEGWFEAIQLFINKEKINFTKAFAIYSDWKYIFPNNQEYIVRNNYIAKGYDAFSLKTRHIICNRSVIISRLTANKFNPVDLSKGLAISEEMFDYQISLYAEKNYYCPYIGSIYYSGLGISTKLQTNEYREEQIQKWYYLLTKYKYSYRDKHYVNYCINVLKFSNNVKASYLLNAIKYFMLSFVCGYWPQNKTDMMKLILMIRTYIQTNCIK